MTEKDLRLRDTVELMNSSDYKERFCAEYAQTKIRYEKLKAYNNKIEAAQRINDPFAPKKLEEPPHDCPVSLLREQQSAMGGYLHILEIRAEIEGINLDDALEYMRASRENRGKELAMSSKTISAE